MAGLHPFLDPPTPLAIAHRGGGLEAEENTLPAFAHAVGLGYSHVELDVHSTRDGVVVIHHDPTLEWMTGDPRAIADLTWADLTRADLTWADLTWAGLAGLRTPGGSGIPRLADLFEEQPGLFINIEPKSDAVVAPLAALIRATGRLGRLAAGSFIGARTARLAAELGPGLCRAPDWRGVLAVRLAGLGLPVARPDCHVLQVPETFHGLAVVTHGFLRAAHRFGLPVQVWTLNDSAEMVRLLDLGVDALMTDRPTLLRNILRNRGQWRGGDA